MRTRVVVPGLVCARAAIELAVAAVAVTAFEAGLSYSAACGGGGRGVAGHELRVGLRARGCLVREEAGGGVGHGGR